MLFDIVIPLGPNEKNNIKTQIEYTKKNVVGYRNIYIISYDKNIELDDCIIIDENIFGFKISDVAEHFAKFNGKNNRNGWYLQQLLKLYAGNIDGILDNYLVIDADVFFMKQTNFIENEKPIFTTGKQFNKPYFKHMKRLDSNFEKVFDKSGISHHMMFNKLYIKEIFDIVEKNHNKKFWKVFIETVDEHTKHHINAEDAGASEYELYFNYMVKYHKDKIIIRVLNWKNVSKTSLSVIDNYVDYDFISICHWINK